MNENPKGNFGITLAALVSLVVGLAMSAIAGDFLMRSLRCGSSPVPVTCARLAHGGPPGSEYVRLIDFAPKWDGYVLWRDDDGQWGAADVPLVVPGSEAPPAVLLRVARPQSEGRLRSLLARPEVTGMVTGRGLRGEYAATLAGQNPGIDPAACWIVSLDDAPANRSLVGSLFVAGVGLFTLSILLFVLRRPVASPETAALRMMSPLVVIVDGLHALAARLPLPSRPIRGALLLPGGAALVAYSGWRLTQIAFLRVADFGPDQSILPILLLDVGVAVTFVALTYLLVQPQQPAEPTLVGALPAAGVR